MSPMPPPPAGRGIGRHHHLEHLMRRASTFAAGRLLGDGEWHNARTIATRLRLSTAGATARIRDLRKPEFGSRRILCRPSTLPGVWDYRMVVEGVRP